MDVSLVQVDHLWACPVAETDLPAEKVQRALLCLRHDAGRDAVRLVRDLLTPLAGTPRGMTGPRGMARRLRFRDATYDLRVRVRRDGLQVRSGHRLGAANLRRLVDALGRLPGARELELHGLVPQYSRAFSKLRACSPCQAKRL